MPKKLQITCWWLVLELWKMNTNFFKRSVTLHRRGQSDLAQLFWVTRYLRFFGKYVFSENHAIWAVDKITGGRVPDFTRNNFFRWDAYALKKIKYKISTQSKKQTILSTFSSSGYEGKKRVVAFAWKTPRKYIVLYRVSN